MTCITFRAKTKNEYYEVVQEFDLTDSLNMVDMFGVVITVYPYPTIWVRDSCIAYTNGGYAGYSAHDAPHIGTPYFMIAPKLAQALLNLKNRGYNVDVDPLPSPKNLEDLERERIKNFIRYLYWDRGLKEIRPLQQATSFNIWKEWIELLSNINLEEKNELLKEE